MLLPDSTYLEIYRTIVSETEKAQFALMKNENAAWKHIARADRAGEPLTWHTQYQHPVSRNRYLLWYHATPKDGGKVLSLLGGIALMMDSTTGDRTLYMAKNFGRVLAGDRTKHPFLLVYTGHFLSRYRERTGVAAGGDAASLAAVFFARNLGEMNPLCPDSMILQKEKYRNAAAWQTSDGVILGSETAETLPDGRTLTVIRNNTFITHELLHENQAESVVPQPFMALVRYLKDRKLI